MPNLPPHHHTPRTGEQYLHTVGPEPLPSLACLDAAPNG